MLSRSFLFFACLGALSCSRTGLLSGSSVELEETPPSDETPDQNELPDDPPPMKTRPEITMELRFDRPGGITQALLAPFSKVTGPFEVPSDMTLRRLFSPDGERLAYTDQNGTFLVDTWPPEPKRLEDSTKFDAFWWLDASRLIIVRGPRVLLYDTVLGTTDMLYEGEADDMPYATYPSPDKRYLAFAVYTAGAHEMNIMDITGGVTVTVAHLPENRAVAWHDWAPDSAHLAYVTTVVAGAEQLRAYSVSTRDGSIGVPVGFPSWIGDSEEITGLAFSPEGTSLCFLLKQGSAYRNYLLDMQSDEPGSSIPLGDFFEQFWPPMPTWAPSGGKLAFSGAFEEPFPHYAELLVDTTAPTPAPVKQSATDLVSVGAQGWSPNGEALYYTGARSDGIEAVFRSDLAGSSMQISNPGEAVEGFALSYEPGCVAYTKLEPEPTVTIVRERDGTHFELAAPSVEASWFGGFDDVYAEWVRDSEGAVFGLFYQLRSSDTDAVAWVDVDDDCAPSEPFFLIPPEQERTFGIAAVSTSRLWETLDPP